MLFINSQFHSCNIDYMLALRQLLSVSYLVKRNLNEEFAFYYHIIIQYNLRISKYLQPRVKVLDSVVVKKAFDSSVSERNSHLATEYLGRVVLNDHLGN